MSPFPVTIKAEADTGVLWTKAEFGKFAVDGIVIRYASEIRTDTRTGVLVAPHGREVHKTDGDEAGAAEPDERRSLAFRNCFTWIGGRCGGRLRRVNHGHRQGRGGRRRGDVRRRARHLA